MTALHCTTAAIAALTLCCVILRQRDGYDSDVVVQYMGAGGGKQPEGSVTSTQRRCAAALRNLSWNDGGEESMVEQGALPALVELAAVKDLETQQHVAATLRNLSTEPKVRFQPGGGGCGATVALN